MCSGVPAFGRHQACVRTLDSSPSHVLCPCCLILACLRPSAAAVYTVETSAGIVGRLDVCSGGEWSCRHAMRMD